MLRDRDHVGLLWLRRQMMRGFPPPGAQALSWGEIALSTTPYAHAVSPPHEKSLDVDVDWSTTKWAPSSLGRWGNRNAYYSLKPIHLGALAQTEFLYISVGFAQWIGESSKRWPVLFRTLGFVLGRLVRSLCRFHIPVVPTRKTAWFGGVLCTRITS